MFVLQFDSKYPLLHKYLNIYFSSDYWWTFVVGDYYLLIRESRQGVFKNGTKEKDLYFNYYNTGASYWNAVQRCRSRGSGWELASFQALFEFKDEQLLTNDLYVSSIYNIE